MQWRKNSKDERKKSCRLEVQADFQTPDERERERERAHLGNDDGT